MEFEHYGKETTTGRGKRKMEGKNYNNLSVFPEFGITEFLFIKINQNCCFAGNVSDDNVKDHEVYNVIDRLV